MHDGASTPRPLIGITANRYRANKIGGLPDVTGHLEAEVAFSDYAKRIAAAGGVPVFVPREDDIDSLLGYLHGVVLTGGTDVDPRRFGERPRKGLWAVDPGRDEFETVLVRESVSRRLPLLGICRGIQIISVALGGTLVPDLPPDAGEAHSFFGYPLSHRSHDVKFVPDCVLARQYGNSLGVNSFHHQAVDRPGTGLRIVGRASDGVAEAIEHEDAPLIAVQWHPDLLEDDLSIFEWLVSEGRSRMVPLARSDTSAF
jgi:putative glutamine amidotransferase